MLWSEIKRWAKQHGYDVSKIGNKNDDDARVEYHWHKIDEPSCSGIARSVSKLAKAIYNDITGNAWAEHQQEYKKDFTQ